MSGDAGAVVNGTEFSQEASHLLDSFERCPSEHAKTVFILDELVPWIQGKRNLPHCDAFAFIKCVNCISPYNFSYFEDL